MLFPAREFTRMISSDEDAPLWVTSPTDGDHFRIRSLSFECIEVKSFLPAPRKSTNIFESICPVRLASAIFSNRNFDGTYFRKLKDFEIKSIGPAPSALSTPTHHISPRIEGCTDVKSDCVCLGLS